jgi:hypothetical protein
VGVVRPGGAALLEERAEDALVARDGARVRLGGGGARGGRAGLEHRDAHAGARAALERGAPALAVAVVLDVERDAADAVALGDRGDEAGGVGRGLVAARHDRVQAEPAAGGERVDGDIAALGDERDRAGLARLEHVAPERHAVRQRHDPVAVGPAHGHPAGGGHERRLQVAVVRLGEARGEHDRAAATELAGLGDDLSSGARGQRDDDRVRRLRQRVERGKRAHAVHDRAARVDRIHAARIREPRKIEQDLAAI